jgi:membrane protein required for colicin V production
MNVLDIILIIPLIWMAYRGFTKGLVLGLATLAALVLGIWAGIRFADLVSDWLGQVTHINERYLPAISFAAIFILVILIVHLIGKAIEKLLDLMAMGFINKLLGGVLGVVKAALLLSILLYLICVFDTHEKLITPKVREGSLLYAPLASVVPRLLPFFNIEIIKQRVKVGELESSSRYQVANSQPVPRNEMTRDL